MRPSDLVAAFFATGIGFTIAGAAVAMAHAAKGWREGHWLALPLAVVLGAIVLSRAARAVRSGPARLNAR